MRKNLLLLAAIFISGLAYSQVTSGLVAKYSFNSGNANDEVGTNNISVQNGATFGVDRFGNTNKAAFLDGVDDYLRTNNPFFYPGNDFTISLWYKSNNTTQSKQTFFNTDPHQQLSVGYNWFGDDSYDIALNDGTSWNICSNATNGLDTFYVNGVTSSNWNHFTMTYDGATWNSYINSSLVNTCNTGTPASTISDLFFGAISVGPQSFFNGLLDDIRIYNRAITPSEVTTLYNEPNPLVSLSTGLVAKYSFNNTNTVDEVGSNDLTAQNGATFGIDRFGNANKAALLDGNDDYLRTTNPFFYPGNDFSISLWYKSNNAAQAKQTFFNTEPHQQISVGYNWFGDNSYDIALNDGTNWNICSNAANGLDTFFVNGVTSSNWNQFTMTYDGTTWNSYINSNLVNTCNTGTPTSTISDLFFGSISVGPQSFFAGLLDDIWVYDRALTPVEITTLFNDPNPMSVGINENMSLKNSISVFPNPNNGEFTIQSQIADVVNVTNELGQLIEVVELNQQNNFSYQVTHLQSGIYFLVGKTIKQKVIVSK